MLQLILCMSAAEQTSKGTLTRIVSNFSEKNSERGKTRNIFFQIFGLFFWKLSVSFGQFLENLKINRAWEKFLYRFRGNQFFGKSRQILDGFSNTFPFTIKLTIFINQFGCGIP